MEQASFIAADQRDQGLQKLRTLTIASLLGGTSLLAFFWGLAAATIPGQSDAGTTASAGTSAATTPSLSGEDQFQHPDDGSFSSGAGAPHVVSGGSR